MSSEDPNNPGFVLAGEHQELELVKCVTCPTMFEFDQAKAWAKQCYDCFKDDKTRRACSACGKHRILPTIGNEWQKICGQCYKDSPLRLCDGCQQPNLKAIEPWRQLCKGCWPQRHSLLRICNVCNDKPINKGAAKWIETCMSCYMTKRKEKFEKCTSCNSTHLSKRKTAPACRECMMKAGQIVIQPSSSTAPIAV